MSSDALSEAEKGTSDVPTSKHVIPEVEKETRLVWYHQTKYIVAVVVLSLGVLTLALGLSLGLNNNNNTSDRGSGTNTNETPDTSTDTNHSITAAATFYTSTRGAFPIQMMQYGAASMAGYETCADMEADLLMAAKFQVNGIIAQNAKYQMPNDYVDYPIYDTVVDYELDYEVVEAPQKTDTIVADSPVEGVTSNQKVAEKTATAADDADEGGGEDSFGTNNQEEGVEEADVVQSDGTYVYAAYGDFLVVWLASTGQVLQKIQMPPAIQEDDPIVVDDPTVVKTATTETVSKVAASYIIGRRPPKPQVQALLLDGDRLVVVVTRFDGNMYPFFMRSKSDTNIISNYGASQVRTYQIKDTGGESLLTLLSVNDLQGDYQDARSIGTNAHLVTMSNINTWDQLQRPLDRWQFKGLSDEEYIASAKSIAEKVVVDFVANLMKELNFVDDSNAESSKCKNVVKVSMFQTGSSDDDDDDDVVEQAFSDGLLQGFLQIHSFDMSQQANDDQTLDMTSVSGCFLPSTYTDLYASDLGLIISAYGYNREPETFDYTQTTYLMGFHLGADGTVTPGASGQVTGHPLNSFAFDLEDGHLRIATTNQARWGRMDDGTWGEISDSSNQVIILEFPSIGSLSTTMEQVGILEGLGHPGESIHAVRFIGDVGFVVTFRRTDPFYTIDVSDPTNPSVVGELNVTGFSSYLHPMDNDNDHLLAIGQEADPKTGRQVGLKISVFDVRDLSNPQEVTKYIVEQSEDASSSSDSQWEHKSFRYLKESNVLILPASVYQWNARDGNFDGFLVFDAKVDGIKPMYNVSHVESSDMFNYCWYSAYLSPRSMVFDGKLTTMKGHTVQSHNLADGKSIWDFNMDKELEAEIGDDCHGYWPMIGEPMIMN